MRQITEPETIWLVDDNKEKVVAKTIIQLKEVDMMVNVIDEGDIPGTS